ncbi:hypothetical protein, partial [Pseudomonas putida]|uniref:hypothetical protein n=1 Tax=Pseudomonas putida TaxID=303 RepID=UPI0035A2616E
HFHTDHPVFSCSKIEQKQLNTWVSFQSAEQPLLGQFSVSGNSFRAWRERATVKIWPGPLGITEIELEVVTRALAAEFTSLEVKVMGAACEVPSPALSVQS